MVGQLDDAGTAHRDAQADSFHHQPGYFCQMSAYLQRGALGCHFTVDLQNVLPVFKVRVATCCLIAVARRSRRQQPILNQWAFLDYGSTISHFCNQDESCPMFSAMRFQRVSTVASIWLLAVSMRAPPFTIWASSNIFHPEWVSCSPMCERTSSASSGCNTICAPGLKCGRLLMALRTMGSNISGLILGA